VLICKGHTAMAGRAIAAARHPHAVAKRPKRPLEDR
jgi:hypothetical protein